jgi:urea transport system permease protein
MSFARAIARVLLLVALILAVAPAVSLAQTLDAETTALVAALPDGSYSDREKVINALAATGNSDLAPLLEALGEGDLHVTKSDNSVVIAVKSGQGFALTDPITGASLGEVGRRDVEKIKVNNSLRRSIRTALGQLTLMSPNASTRFEAAQAILKTADAESLELIDTAIAAETDARVLRVLEQARAVIVLRNDYPLAEKTEAVATLAAKGGQDVLAILKSALPDAENDLKPVIQSAITGIEGSLAVWGAVQNVWYGLSLGSVLLLAAIGLAITFGVMGVINMAHGEIVMLGAYTTYVVQEIIRNNFPFLFDYSLAIALPLAFLVAGAVGIAIERGIIRFLYGRPLETLLATWGLSLILQQAVRTVFGPNNREVGNPSWMSGTFDFLGLAITWNRLWIVVFALVVFGVLLLVLNRTPLGLQMRAVTQNRRMASAMGIRTPYVDALTFGLGSGIAGMAGVALSQIDNVSPNLGQSYIIDSFMVVVFGGVGNLWGTLVGAMTLGIANKFLEPYAGAVLAKIVILVFIILFIQRRPRGLFALKGRAVEQ